MKAGCCHTRLAVSMKGVVMAKKTATYDCDRDSASARKRQRGTRALSHQSPRVNAADALSKAANAPTDMLAAADILALQRTAGNRAVQHILAQGLQHHQQSHLSIQAKLAVGASDDPYEREADRVAATVMQTSAASAPHIQRQPEEDEEMVQRKPLASAITPMTRHQESREENEEGTHVRRVDGRRTSVEPAVELSIESARGGGQPLPHDLRNRMEQSFGADFSAVRVKADANADNLNRALRSRAFTTGQDLFFKRGEYDPASHAGQEVIAHELAHVVQQTGNVVRRHESARPHTTATQTRRPNSPALVKLRTTAVGHVVQLLSLKEKNELKRMINGNEIKGLRYDSRDAESNLLNYKILRDVMSDKGWSHDKSAILVAAKTIADEMGIPLNVQEPEEKKAEAEEKFEISPMKRGEFAKKLISLGCISSGKDKQNHDIYLNPATSRTTSLGIGGHGDNVTQDEGILKKYLKQLEVTPEAWNKV